jgi:hypothetical protein
MEPVRWMGYQFHRADLDEGMVLLFRRSSSPYTAVEIRLRGLSSETVYELTFEGTGETRRGTGEELSKPIAVTIPNPRGSALITYRKHGR